MMGTSVKFQIMDHSW